MARRVTATHRTLALALAALIASAVGLEHATSAQASRVGTGRLEIQARLAELGYLPANTFSGIGAERTREAVVAFQSWEGLERNGVAEPATLARLATASRPTPRPVPARASRSSPSARARRPSRRTGTRRRSR